MVCRRSRWGQGLPVMVALEGEWGRGKGDRSGRMKDVKQLLQTVLNRLEGHT